MGRSTFDGPLRIRRGASVITTDATSLAAGAEVTFTVTNSFVTATSVPVIAMVSGATADTSVPIVSAVANGSFNIRLTNLAAATADTGAMVINFIIFNGSNAAGG